MLEIPLLSETITPLKNLASWGICNYNAPGLSEITCTLKSLIQLSLAVGSSVLNNSLINNVLSSIKVI